MAISKQSSRALTILAALLCSSIRSTDGLRILGLFPYQAHSHFVMCEELMRGLADRGHRVDVYSHFPLEDRHENYHDFSLRGSLPALANNLTYDDLAIFTSRLQFVANVLRESARSMCQLLLDHPLLRKLRDDPPTNPPYDLVIMEYSQSNCYIPWGRRLKIPVIGIVTLPTLDWIYAPMGSPFNLATDPSVFSVYTTPMTFFERLSNVLIYHTTSLIFNHVIRQQDKYVQQIFGPDYPNNVELVKDFSLILLNQNSALNGIRPFPPSVVPVGGLHIVDRKKTIPQEVRKWLDESTHGCLYFSFGSMIRIETFSKTILETFYKVFENIAPIRVLLKIRKPELLPANLPSNVITHPWLPQIQVLKHRNIKIFVTHGGLMGSQESIYYGVPMIGIPFFGDQYFNVDSYVKKKIAFKLNVHEITEETFTSAINEVLKNPTYKEAIDKISLEFKDRPMTPMKTATYWVEYVSRHGKDSLRSPIVDMPWWQATLIDVYGFITAILFIVLYVAVKLLKLLTRLISSKVLHRPTINRKKHN